jgi:hypothetical protein
LLLQQHRRAMTAQSAEDLATELEQQKLHHVSLSNMLETLSTRP